MYMYSVLLGFGVIVYNSQFVQLKNNGAHTVYYLSKDEAKRDCAKVFYFYKCKDTGKIVTSEEKMKLPSSECSQFTEHSKKAKCIQTNSALIDIDVHSEETGDVCVKTYKFYNCDGSTKLVELEVLDSKSACRVNYKRFPKYACLQSKQELWDRRHELYRSGG